MLDHGYVKEAEKNVFNKRGKYIKYSAVQRYEIGKYASEYSAASTLRKYKGEFPEFNKSTVLLMQQKCKEELRQSLKEKRGPKTKLPTARRGRPLMLRKLDLIVRNYIRVHFRLVVVHYICLKKKNNRIAFVFYFATTLGRGNNFCIDVS